ncbi:MAG: phenylacetic acid degradation bifunctional protein PaaZ [Calditrichia bacterium]
MNIQSYVQGAWFDGSGKEREVFNAVTGEKIGDVTSEGMDYKGVLEYGRKVGGHALRKMTFHERGRMLKALAMYLNERRKQFYPVSAMTGATKADNWIDIDGGIGTLFVYASKGRRELPDQPFLVEGNMEALSKGGTFVGRHICVPLEGTAIHINAFNFPCWGMLEKLAPTLLAGMPAIIKPATSTGYLTEAVVRSIIESGILPEGALQLVCGGLGDMLSHVDCQDVVTLTGSAKTGHMLKTQPAIIQNSVRFNMEADSLNCSILGPDATPDRPEFDLFIKEVAREMTVKAGQKCTAIRRTIVPQNMISDVMNALKARLDKVTLGDPAVEGVRMGPLVSRGQVNEVRSVVEKLSADAELVYGKMEDFDVVGADPEKGAFFPTTLLYCDQPFKNTTPHDLEAFGPVNTIMPYANVDEAVELAKMGKGSLVGSLFTGSDAVARDVVLGTAAYHGRIMVVNEYCSGESTGHGSPLPHMVHGGPGRAGGGEELGGIRSVMHYMQRTALQGSPTTLTQISQEWMPGAAQPTDRIHPFQKYYEELEIGETLTTHRRTITEADIVNFAGISGDYFYAHTDKIAAEKHHVFKKRVAHGYFVVSAAAGLFVWPGEGPVLANYGMEKLRFIEPTYIGDTIHLKITCMRKTEKEPREEEPRQGVVEWFVEIYNQDNVVVANYVILTLVAKKDQS